MPSKSESPSKKLQTLGFVVAWGCVLMAVAQPAMDVLQWTFTSPAGLVEARLSPVAAGTLAPTGALTAQQRIIGAVIGTVPALILSWGLFRARTALAAIGAGRFFAREVVEGLKGYAVAALWSAIASFLLQPLLSVGLTYANPEGHRVLTVGVSSDQVFSVLGAGILWLIVAALAQGASAAHENEQFV